MKRAFDPFPVQSLMRLPFLVFCLLPLVDTRADFTLDPFPAAGAGRRVASVQQSVKYFIHRLQR